MILEFAVENFRSIKSRQVLSLVAESSKAKADNVFEASLPNDGSVRLLKTALIYGANASGKSNLIRALGSLVDLVLRPTIRAGRPIRGYDPFRFSKETQTQPTIFEITFLLDNIKYRYKISFNFAQIVSEELVYFPKGQTQRIFEREDQPDELIHKARLGKNFGNKEIEAFNNQPVLNKFGSDTPQELLTKVYDYFNGIEVSKLSVGGSYLTSLMRRRSQNLLEQEGLFKKLESLMRFADTQIDGLGLEQKEIPRTRRSLHGELIEDRVLVREVAGRHKFYENGIEVGFDQLDLSEESEGTRALFWRGGLILEKLERGGVLVFDELDNSLHPKLVKFLVLLFTNPRTNPKNAQLIFATHEVTLLDRDLFRTDQIWFTEKNGFGETELFSAQDFAGVREDVPFDKWYMAGKFGGLPKIEDIGTIFNHAE